MDESRQKLNILPVRHHSPAAAMAVERELVALRPRLVLIEGPSDATDLIPLLLQPDTRPPVAILAYRPARDGEEPRAMVDPFCDYSPELVAMQTAFRLGAAIRFFDAPAAAWFDLESPRAKAQSTEEVLPDAAPPELFQALAGRFGFSTHEEFWDSRFEMGAPETLVELIGSYGDMVRDWFAESGTARQIDRARESWMLTELARALEEGYRPEEVAIVCGAAHGAGLRDGEVDQELVERLRRAEPARFALIPYSFPRLSEQSGYGAGNRAPAFYQEVWRLRGDWNGASGEFLLRLMNRMRGRGFALSLADAIEAQRLATNLAGLRDKPAVGLEEVRDAAITCYGRGSHDPTPHMGPLLIGEEVGAISSQAARTSLQQEFHDQVKRCGIPFSDSPRDLRLNLTNPGEQASSAFLHRLLVAGVPFARLAATGSLSPAGRPTGRREESGDPLERLLALKEKWEVCWTPATEIRLIEMAVYGNTLAEVCGRLLRRQLEAARNLEQSARVLLDVVVGRLEALYEEALSACERASSGDDDFSSLARACYLLDLLAGYGQGAEQQQWLARLGERVFVRACLLLPSAAEVAEEEAPGVSEGVKLLHQVAVRRRQRGEETGLLAERLASTAEGNDQVSPLVAGLACALLYLDGHLSDERLVGALKLRLSRAEEPPRAAQFVEGLFSLNRSVLVRNRAIVASLNGFLRGLGRDAFLAVLPVLRRSLTGLNHHEMGYLVATIGAILGIGAETAEKAVAGEGQLEELAALDQELGELFG